MSGVSTIKVTILGCGSSGGVPRVGGDWGACDPTNPKNRRRRCSILVECWQGEGEVPREERTTVLVDTSPDLREQLLDAGVQHVDAVLYTHDHGDQTHGIDDLRAIAYRKRNQIPVYMNEATKNDLLQRFRYCFVKPEGRVHPPILELKPVINAGDVIEIDGPGGVLSVGVIEIGHGNINALGFVFAGKLAYTPDVHTIDETAMSALQNLDLWIVDALRYHSHPTHAHADRTLQWAARSKAKQIVLTNMHIDMDYDTLRDEMPGNQIISYDGFEVKI